MTTLPSTISATLPPGYTAPSNAESAQTVSSSGINSSTFLQLLVAQLQYQDPNNPTDPTQYLSETASFEEVQQLESLQSSVQSLASLQESGTSVGLLGQTVKAENAAGNGTVTGTVTAIQMGGNGPELTINGQQVPLANVLKVSQTGSSSGSTSSSGSSSTSGGGSSSAP